MQRTIEQRMKVLEEMIAEIHACVVMGQAAVPGEAEYRRAIDAAVDGNMKPLSLYLSRGGVVPKAETIYPDAAVQRGRSNAPKRRSANLPTAATTPVMPPDNKEQRRVA